jgi:hypothetical protein
MQWLLQSNFSGLHDHARDQLEVARIERSRGGETPGPIARELAERISADLGCSSTC